MGFHVCEYCLEHPATSSGDVTLRYRRDGEEHSWEMPDMIMHYIIAHSYLPPQAFIDDVLEGTYVGGRRLQTKGLPQRVGYLSGDFPKGDVPYTFIAGLESDMRRADHEGNRNQMRGFSL